MKDRKELLYLLWVNLTYKFIYPNIKNKQIDFFLELLKFKPNNNEFLQTCCKIYTEKTISLNFLVFEIYNIM
jgi:hypothetical protein